MDYLARYLFPSILVIFFAGPPLIALYFELMAHVLKKRNAQKAEDYHARSLSIFDISRL